MTQVETDAEQVVVVVEDDPNIADLVDMYLRDDGFRVYQATRADTALERIRTRRPDLVIVDIVLDGDRDGFGLCADIRAESKVPIIVLTSRDDEEDRLRGLDLGADDYVTKPFSPRELVARVRAILRRTAPTAPPPPGGAVMVIDRLEIRPTGRQVLLDGSPVELTNREFDLLEHLFENRGIALSRPQLLDEVWGPTWEGDERTVDVHVAQLRRKLGDSLHLMTVHGLGYRLD